MAVPSETSAGDGRVRVLVVDDHPVYRDGVARAIEEHPDLELVGEAEDGPGALELSRALKPDVCVLDLRLPGVEGTEVVKGLRLARGAPRVIVVSAFADGEIVHQALASGAAGYLAKDASRAAICDAIVAVAAGDTVLPAELQGRLADHIRAGEETAGVRLTARETEVLRLAAEGLLAPAIAARLFLSPTTVKTHLQHVYEKLGVSDRAAAVAEAMRQGLLS